MNQMFHSTSTCIVYTTENLSVYSSPHLMEADASNNEELVLRAIPSSKAFSLMLKPHLQGSVLPHQVEILPRV